MINITPDLVDRRHRGANPFGAQAKLLLHWDRVCSYLATDDCAPVMMEINPTNRCNLHCSHCISENMRAFDDLRYKETVQFLDDFTAMGGKGLIFSGGGEPTLHRDFGPLALYAREKGLDLGLMTNGVYPERLNDGIGQDFVWVRFSLDRQRRGYYKSAKGFDGVDRIMGNIMALREAPVRVWVNCNVDVRHTKRSVRLLIKKLLPVVDGIQFRPLLPRPFKGEEAAVNEMVWEYLLSLPPSEKIALSRDKLDEVRDKRFFQFRACDGHMFVPILNANGDVCICMYQTLDERFTFGNIYRDDFRTIWASQRRREVVEFVRGLDYAKAGCQPCCKLSEINKLLAFVRYVERPRDGNFL